jgi:predicted small lipoprotein YifL
MKITTLVAISAMAFAIAACGKKDEPKTAPPAPSSPTSSAPAAGVTVGTVTVGNAIGADKKVQGSGAIGVKDTIYVSVDTTGSGEATLKSRWTYLKDGTTTVVKEDTQRVSTSGSATHEFHISKPDGWPKGDYQVEVFVNDAPAGSRKFSVS